MKRNNILAYLATFLLFISCKDFNEQNFEGLDETGKVTNVGNYEIEYSGKYPTDGYFTSKEEVADSVARWLAANYYACDSGSVAKVSVLYADSLEIPQEPTSAYTLSAEDYDSMGTERDKPGKYNNFSESIDAMFYLPIFLKQKFPYTKANEVIAVTYAYFANSQTTDRTSTFVYDGNIWTSLADLPRVTISTKIAEFVYTNKWQLSKILGGIEKYTLVHEDYQILFDWVATNKSDYLSTTSPATDEYYFGVATGHDNVNNNVSVWKDHYQPNNDFDGMTDEQIEEVMYSRIASGLAELILPVRYPNPESGINYQITYAVYRGHASAYTLTFMYDDIEKVFSRTAGPDY